MFFHADHNTAFFHVAHYHIGNLLLQNRNWHQENYKNGSRYETWKWVPRFMYRHDL